MFNANELCPQCRTQVTNWERRCPRCQYHPDSNKHDYNRALDDVALVACYRRAPRERVWKHSFDAWLGRLASCKRSLIGA